MSAGSRGSSIGTGPSGTPVVGAGDGAGDGASVGMSATAGMLGAGWLVRPDIPTQTIAISTPITATVATTADLRPEMCAISGLEPVDSSSVRCSGCWSKCLMAYSGDVTRRAITVTVIDCPRTLPEVRAMSRYVSYCSSRTSLLTPTFAMSGVSLNVNSWISVQMS